MLSPISIGCARRATRLEPKFNSSSMPTALIPANRLAIRRSAFGSTMLSGSKNLHPPTISMDCASSAMPDQQEMDIAAGEYGYDSWYFRRMLNAGAVDVLQADATRCAGIAGFRGSRRLM